MSTIREALEQRERDTLSPHAAKSADSKGRLRPEAEDDVRPAFQHDRDRIIHSKAFRRLKHKTQVFVYHEGDHFRTRLTHSLEVAQIARTICRALRLDEDLGEAVALAHDLGHTPFGHAGEEALHAAMKPFGGFDHNAQTLRILTKLEERYAEFNGLNENPDRPLFNRAVRGVYPPGSTIKPVVALAGLKHGVLNPLDATFCSGGFSLPNSTHRFRDWRPKGHGRVDLVSAIAQSCDVYFYELATRLGVQRLSDFLGSFGLGARTGIDIAGEKTGLVPSPDWKRDAFKSRRAQVWFPGETVILGIGQGYIPTTPLQLAHMAGIIGLRGTSAQPRLVRSLRDPVTRKVAPVATKLSAGPEVGDAKNWDLAIAGMFAVTHGGTASRSAAGAPYSIAGKTGTAQVFSIAQNAKYDEGAISERMRDHAWFIAFAPVEAPKIAVAVLVENGRSGSGTAAPIARLVMDAYLLRKFPTNGNAAAAAAGDSSEE